MSHIQRVENYPIDNGGSYSGNFDVFFDRPFGWGICRYPDGHEAIGNFCGIPNGPAYINYGNYMQLGFFGQGQLNGWGIQMGNGSYAFGVFRNGQLIKDCTFLIEETHDRISSLSRSIRAKGISVRWAHCFSKNREVFFGVAQKGYYMIGIHFLLSGDVYIGRSPYSLDITGTFVHLRGTNVEAGVYSKGTLVHKCKGFLVHSENWIELLQTDNLTFSTPEINILETSLAITNIFVESDNDTNPF